MNWLVSGNSERWNLVRSLQAEALRIEPDASLAGIAVVRMLESFGVIQLVPGDADVRVEAAGEAGAHQRKRRPSRACPRPRPPRARARDGGSHEHEAGLRPLGHPGRPSRAGRGSARHGRVDRLATTLLRIDRVPGHELLGRLPRGERRHGVPVDRLQQTPRPRGRSPHSWERRSAGRSRPDGVPPERERLEVRDALVAEHVLAGAAAPPGAARAAGAAALCDSAASANRCSAVPQAVAESASARSEGGPLL